MNKQEMAKKLYALSDNNGRVKLEDFAKLVFDGESPQEVVDNFLKDADKLAEAEDLWNEVGRLSKAITTSQLELKNLQNEFNRKYERLKEITKELGMDEYTHLP